MKLVVGDLVQLKKPIGWIGENVWRVKRPPVGDSVCLEHSDRRVHYTTFKLEDIERLDDNTGPST